MVLRAQAELVADHVELVALGVLERGLAVREDRRGVHHGRIEHHLEEVVAEIVVGGDVRPAAAEGIAAPTVEEGVERPAEAREAAVHAVEHLAVADHDPHEVHERLRLPEAEEVALARPDAAAETGVAVEVGVADPHGHPRSRVGGIAERRVAEGVVDLHLPPADAVEGRQQPATDARHQAGGNACEGPAADLSCDALGHPGLLPEVSLARPRPHPAGRRGAGGSAPRAATGAAPASRSPPRRGRSWAGRRAPRA